MKILIFGSEGFIGQHLVHFFLKNSHTVTGCDLFGSPSQDYRYYKVSRTSPEYDDIFHSQSFDVCINAAGSGNVPYSMNFPMNDFEANVLDNIRILDCLRKYQSGCKYIYISSAAVYGNPEVLPIKESDRVQPLSPYGWHKLTSENLCKEYSQIFGIPTACVRPFSVYGPGLQKQLFWDLYTRYKRGEKDIELWGTGKESRDFIFISDVVESISLIIEKDSMSGEAYNIASGFEITISEIATIFFEAFAPTVRIRFNGHVRSGDPLNWRADISKLRKLGFEPEIKVHQGIKLLSEWMKSLN